MTKAAWIGALVVGLFVGAVPAFAHHSFAAEYDATKPVTLTGTITRIEWINPHAWIYLDVTGTDGQVVNWALELPAPHSLFRRGWKKTDLSVGSEVTVRGYLAKDGSQHAAARNITLPDGSKLSADLSGPTQRPSREAPLLAGLPSVALVRASVALNLPGDARFDARADQSAVGQSDAVKPIPAELPAIVARVNGEAIERWELEAAVRDFDAQSGHQLPAEMRDEALRAILDEILAEHLMVQEAHARKIEVAEAEVQARLTQIRSDFPNEAAFEKTLAASGMSLDELRLRTRRSLEIDKLIAAEIEPKIAVQEADVVAFYEENIERFRLGGQSLAAARTSITEFLADQQRDEKTDAFIRQLRAQAKIEIYV